MLNNILLVVAATTVFAASLGIDLTQMTKTATGLYWRDLTVGTGTTATVGTRASVRYTGWLANGTQFDSNVSNSAPLTVLLGAQAVIAGFDEGIRGMKIGGQRQVIIPPNLGYGTAGSGAIPGNAIIVFRIELVAVQ